MLQRLHIENYALIDQLDFVPSRTGMNIVTGETGAGKSIIIGALGLVLGERADSAVLRDQTRKCIVEATFDLHSSALLPHLLEEHDLDSLDPTIIRREINPAGRSRAFVNDTPVQLTVLKALGSVLVDVHSQNQNLKLKEPGFQYQILDSYAGNQELLAEYKMAFAKYQNCKKELEQLLDAQSEFEKEKDYKSFLFDELHAASLDDFEPDDIESQVLQLENSEELQTVGANGAELIDGAEQSVTDQLAAFQMELNKLSRVFPQMEALSSRLQSVLIELREMASELQDLAADAEVDPARTDELNQKLQLYRSLLSKHRAGDIVALRKVRDDLDTELQNLHQNNSRIDALQAEVEKWQTQCEKKANQLYLNRKNHRQALGNEWKKDLDELGMPNAEVDFALEPTKVLNPWGSDKLTILFSPNKGGNFEPLSKIASGGELSRVMLIVKSYLARFSTLPTMVLDEIDTGVSGETARRVAEMMERVSREHQLITITHLPQIAAKGTRHFYVYKEDGQDRTRSYIRELDEASRIQEIAKMLSGENPSENALKNAKELIEA